jgi:hypothetical protein
MKMVIWYGNCYKLSSGFDETIEKTDHPRQMKYEIPCFGAIQTGCSPGISGGIFIPYPTTIPDYGA